MKSYKKIFTVLVLILVLSAVGPKSAVAAETPQTRCTAWVTSPHQSGKTLSVTGYVYCGISGMLFPYLNVCIVKKTFFGKKDISCSPVDVMGASYSEWKKTISASCDGKGIYYGELRWRELTSRNMANLITAYALLFTGPSRLLYTIGKKPLMTTFTLKSISYEYCR